MVGCLQFARPVLRAASQPKRLLRMAAQTRAVQAALPAVITPGAGKAVGKDAALQIVAKSLADVGLGGVVVALAVELTCTGQLKPGLEVLGYGLVEQSPLGVARVVELWLCTPAGPPA